MNAAQVLEVLVRSGATVGRTHRGQAVALGLPSVLEHALADPELTLAIAGHGTGHRWATCTICRRTQLIATGSEQPCKITPRCKGRLKAYAKARPDTRPTIDLDGQPAPCARPGCDRPATHRTAWHELVCTADFAHLALANVTRRTTTP